MSFEKVRNILYEVMTADDNTEQDNLEPMIRATQNMGVSVSSAVTKNGGVKIFQLQNIVHQKVIRGVVDALKELDAMASVEVIDAITVPQLKRRKEDILAEIVEEALDNEISLALFLKPIETQYVLAADQRYETHKETAAKIKISYSKLMQVKRSVS